MDENKKRRYRKVGEEFRTLRQHIQFRKDVKELMGHVEKKLVKTFHEKPSKEALDRLALFVGFQNWDSFEKTLKEDKNVPEAIEQKEDKESLRVAEKEIPKDTQQEKK